MRFSNLFTITSKEVPKDCVLKSNEYLVRGGFIKQVGSGIYHFLPLGKMVLDKVSKIIKEEMDKSGANELSLGFVTPSELWIKSHRYNKYGKELLKFKDRKDNDFILGPTYEEAITECVNYYINSYKQLPLNLYQINIKFRDEIRPRFGLMRSREFIMKDAYSFHSDTIDLDREFELMEQTYIRIFNALGVDFRVVEADSGAIGGSGSKEFMILANSGEDDVVVCESCEYASNIEVASRAKRGIMDDDRAPKAEFSKFYTPNVKSTKDVATFFHTSEFWILKCVVKKAILNNLNEEFCFFFLRGDDTLSNVKAMNCVGDCIELTDVCVDELNELGLFAGFIGPYGLRNITNAKHIYFDIELKDCDNLICGANELDYHFIGVNLAEFLDLSYAPLAEVQNGNKCPKCNGNLNIKKGIEVGHIFKLGTRYSQPLNATFLDANGRSNYFEMGCYGIGVSRILPAILEQKSDSHGCIWGKVAPFKLVIIISNIKNQQEVAYANELYKALKSLDVEVLIDDRDLRFGVKINDFELLGFSNALIVGKGLQNGKLELIKREGLIKSEIDSNIEAKDLAELINR